MTQEQLIQYTEICQKAQQWAVAEGKILEIDSWVVRVEPMTYRTTVILNGIKQSCDILGEQSRADSLKAALAMAGVPVE